MDQRRALHLSANTQRPQHAAFLFVRWTGNGIVVFIPALPRTPVIVCWTLEINAMRPRFSAYTAAVLPV